MTGLPENIEQMLLRLTENSRTELEIVRALADGIRRVDEQMLREVRNVALQHDVRREAIFGELQELAARLCAMPQRSVMTAINKREYVHTPTAIEANPVNGGGDWRKAAQMIDDELSEIFKADDARH
ncbi:MAG: hypothetical protein WBP38_07925 [Hyphomicrobium sp.]|jgi:hypothetical protein|nr:hypothetical protein [Hyphomicrobium sp.]